MKARFIANGVKVHPAAQLLGSGGLYTYIHTFDAISHRYFLNNRSPYYGRSVGNVNPTFSFNGLLSPPCTGNPNSISTVVSSEPWPHVGLVAFLSPSACLTLFGHMRSLLKPPLALELAFERIWVARRPRM